MPSMEQRPQRPERPDFAAGDLQKQRRAEEQKRAIFGSERGALPRVRERHGVEDAAVKIAEKPSGPIVEKAGGQLLEIYKKGGFTMEDLDEITGLFKSHTSHPYSLGELYTKIGDSLNDGRTLIESLDLVLPPHEEMPGAVIAKVAEIERRLMDNIRPKTEKTQ